MPLHLYFSELIVFAFSDNLSAENSKLSAEFVLQLLQLLECMSKSSKKSESGNIKNIKDEKESVSVRKTLFPLKKLSRV